MKHLFIGGTADGQFIDVQPSQNEVRIARPVLTTSLAIAASVADSHSLKCDCYRREKLRDSNGKELFVFVLGNDSRGIIERLIDGYRAN